MAADCNDLRYDEDDYVPPGYVPRKSGSGRGKVLVAVVIVGLVIGAFAVSHVMRSRVRARDEEIMRVHAAQNALIESRQSGLVRSISPAGGEFEAQPGLVWGRLLGTWSRMPDPDEVGRYPIRFEFRSGRPTVVTHADNRSIEVTILIRRQSVETIELEARPLVPDPGPGHEFYHGNYQFTFESNDTILLDDMMSGLAFTREAVSSARSDKPPR
jgi:hypothetical protein